MASVARSAMRQVKNFTKGYNDIQAKVREATSNEADSPSELMMNEIAMATFNQADFIAVMEILDKRLGDKGRYWRHVLKALIVMHYCVLYGHEQFVIYCQKNIHLIKTQREFQHYEGGVDHGASVREQAKALTSLLLDEGRLRDERARRADQRSRMGMMGASGGGMNAVMGLQPIHRSDSFQEELNHHQQVSNSIRRQSTRGSVGSGNRRPRSQNELQSMEDREIALAIEASKVTAREEAEKKRPGVNYNSSRPQAASTANIVSTRSNMSSPAGTVNRPRTAADDDADLRRAIEMSKREEEERQRQKAIDNQNELVLTADTDDRMPVATYNPNDLLGDFTTTTTTTTTTTGAMNRSGQQNQPLIDLLGGFDDVPANNYNPYQQNQSPPQQYGQSQPTFNQFSQPLVNNDYSGYNPFAASAPAPAPAPVAAPVAAPASSSFNPFASSTSATSGAPGASFGIGNAFDTGSNAHLLPHQTAGANNPASLLAEIARNSEKIDPFAGLAASRAAASSSSPGGGASTNPFAQSLQPQLPHQSQPVSSASSNPFAPIQPSAANSNPFGAPSSLSTSAAPALNPYSSISQPQPQQPSSGSGGNDVFSSLLDLDPMGSGMGSSSMSSTVNKNPFGASGPSTVGTNNTWGTGGGNSLAALASMSSNSGSVNMMNHNTNAFGSSFGGAQSPPSPTSAAQRFPAIPPTGNVAGTSSGYDAFGL